MNCCFNECWNNTDKETALKREREINKYYYNAEGLKK
jgi:hypothetical protein